MQALVAGVEHRCFDGHLAVLEQVVAQAQLQRRPGAGVVVGGGPIRVARQQAGARVAPTAIQLDAEEAMGIDAQSQDAGGEAGLDFGDEALRPLLLIALAGWGGAAEVVVQEEVAVEQGPTRCAGRSHLRLGRSGAEQEGQHGQACRCQGHVIESPWPRGAFSCGDDFNR
ncbi:hypothetical protein D9M70_461130 [compost metagenome]